MFYHGKETQYFQLTPMGLSRLQSGKLPPRIDPETKRVLGILVRLDGVAEWDELTGQSGMNPTILATILRRLIDLGYVTTAVPQEPAPTK